ncbi:molecular chaperone Hsp90 [Lacrimispora sp.]|uniref:molecular chaperone Hsp90 n=1 Tax=Lacrimispora sp. TaxID=2719234 RepID=UPI003992CAAF
MDKELLNYVIEKTHEFMSAPSCSKEAKEAAQIWLDAVGTDREAVETKKYIDQLEQDIMPVDGLIGLAESEEGMKFLGADVAKNIAMHAKEIKSAGKKYCDCPACSAVEAILEKKDTILKEV